MTSADVTHMRGAIKHFDGTRDEALELLERCRALLGWVEEWSILLYPDRLTCVDGTVTLAYDGAGWDLVQTVSEARQ